MKRRIWFIVAVIVLIAGFSSAGFFFFAHEADSLTVSELKLSTGRLDQQLRVEGKVAPGSVDWDGESQVMRFVLADDKESLSVVYKGIVPDSFKPGIGLTVEGRYRSGGVFEASGFGSDRSFCTVCH